MFAAVYCSTIWAQELTVDKVVSIQLPPGSKKVPKAEIKTVIISKSTSKTPINRQTAKGEFYKIDNALMQLSVAKGTFKSSRLEDLKKSLEEMAKGTENFTSEIKSINNYKVLIICHELKNSDLGYYSFYTLSNNRNAVLNGMIEYKKSEKAKTSTLLNQFLEKMKFK